ncbi:MULTISPECIES: MauE/DoxX family redox-associated membrane protein [Streptomyces]|uniref:Methylamine utilisation protein MauE domain-containing protein n=1 Tax=Streptomyces tsukubensis (strain DSM 42081 / NBRC 108919 / NRRL 18488 / 9993) TaxID=1114943 RepID=I2N832_STRT9|nr:MULTISPECIES: MauE/DoxX family redox-associated membrane protein [Streptomyces]AZK96991.1 hypothetical protein B7R87_26315 [Streptomyces tsukubensis]EIF93179.1 hypothetical protein [Streptomyces tsukubensis NRRL18488]MYS66575.1 hypothetical protein [Streptomyces sp. SID5473]QKM67028.1 hypothetical protein STSU_007465 [Streptomyces tsukubensis NRRL18488]TAI41493.1 hypothetical protein EWI31_26990 [Streptomyces tsukubensis]
MQAIGAFGQICLAAVFVWSAVLKFRDLRTFQRHIVLTVPAFGRSAFAVALAIPVLEVGIALALFLRHPVWAGFGAAGLMLLAFTVYLWRILRSRPGVSCGCVGSAGSEVSAAHLVRNAVLLVICAGAWWATASSEGPGPVDYALVAAPAAVVGVTLLHLGELAALFRFSQKN